MSPFACLAALLSALLYFLAFSLPPAPVGSDDGSIVIPVRSLHTLLLALAVTVEPQKDLGVQQQLLDVLILRRGTGPSGREMPDGMEDLAGHNLITFKSHHEPMDEWAVSELISHYVAYRKLVGRISNGALSPPP